MEPGYLGEEDSLSRHVPTLFTVCAKIVSENMVRLEQGVCDLPTAILRELLQFLNIYDLERIEEVVVKKGISTQALWLQLWKDLIGTNPKIRTEPFNWRQKFLQTFFHGVLWGTLDILNDRRLINSRSSALVLGSRHVSKLVIRNKLQGVKELADNPSICTPLTCTVHKLVFQHLRSVDLLLEHSLLKLLHSLVHHGVVEEVALSHWNEPYPELLSHILRTSAGLWCEGKREDQGTYCCDEGRLKMGIESMEPTVQSNILDCCHQQLEKTAYCTLPNWTFTTTENIAGKKIMSPSVNMPSAKLIPPSTHCVNSEETSYEKLCLVSRSSCCGAHRICPKKRKSCGTMCGTLSSLDVHTVVSEVQPCSGSHGMALVEPNSCAYSSQLEQRPTYTPGKICDESNCCNGQKLPYACSKVVKKPRCPDQYHDGSGEKPNYSHETDDRTFIKPSSSSVITGTSEQLVSHCEFTNDAEKQTAAITEEGTYSTCGSFSEGPLSPGTISESTNAHNRTLEESCLLSSSTWTSEDLVSCFTNQRTCKKPRLTDMFNIESAEKSKITGLSEATEKPEDIYDYIFMIGGKKADIEQNTSGTDENTGNLLEGLNNSDFFGQEQVDNTSLSSSPQLYLRSVSVLEMTSVSLSYKSSRMLCKLLSSWVSLQKLVLEYNGLGPAIFPILKELCVLSRCHDNSLSTLVLKDDILHLPIIKLVKILLGIFPRLRTLHMGFLLEIQNESLENELLMAAAEITDSCLEDLSLSCTDKPLQVDLLLPVLRPLKFLRRLCLHRASFGAPEELGKLLHATTYFLSALDWVTIQDVNLAVCFKEVLDLLHSAPLKGLTLDNCRLFERQAAETVSEIVTALKQNQSLKFLSLPANRLGNEGLLSLAKLFTEDSLSRISSLNVSANCIRGNGLLKFARLLMTSESELSGGLKLKELNVSENLFFRDPALTQEALELFKNKCHVITIQSLTEPLQAFADHISVM
ncbi:leucine-rich repeat-containing protein 41 [Carcharodon carcharias]|uniref:leucine-rich repeat-containing protein 41 n=1 Tax=Carcharodon carcharias TaxID=13397 RepID=UPI001B7DD456|nr:leucine-rich repeat-containing protein 41 [Carcharodon carcharias]